MPVYEHTYRAYEGAPTNRLRWWPIIQQEWRLFWKSRLFWFLLVIAALHFFGLAIYIYAIDFIQANQNHPMADAVRRLPITQVTEDLFFTFIRNQSPIVFLLILLVGSGYICNDFRYNLVEIYFSKPLSWLDYALGKMGALMLLGASLTFAPVLALLLLHFIFVPTTEVLRELYWVPFAAAGYCLVIVFSYSLVTLAGSALFNSPRLAAIAIFMFIALNGAFGSLLPGLLRKEALLFMVFPVAINRLGELFFGRTNLAVPVSWIPSAIMLGIVALPCLFVLVHKIRKVGTGT